MINLALLLTILPSPPGSWSAPLSTSGITSPGSPSRAIQEAAAQSPAPPGDGLVFVEIPDVPALLRAYAHAPVVQMISDEAVRVSVSDLLQSTGVEVGPAVQKALESVGIPGSIAAAPLETARAMLDEVRSVSFSVALAGDTAHVRDGLAKTAEAIAELTELERAIGKFTDRNQDFPPGSLEELDVPAEVRTDPWGRPYRLSVDLTTLDVELTCLGADGDDGGAGFAADIDLSSGAGQLAEDIAARSLEFVTEIEFVRNEGAAAAWAHASKLGEPLGWQARDERRVRVAGREARVLEVVDPEQPQRGVWILADGLTLSVGYGEGSLERVLARHQVETNRLDPGPEITALAEHLGEARGATVVSGWAQLQRIEDVLLGVEQAVEAAGGGRIERVPFGGGALFRMQLDGERFVSELVNTCRDRDAEEAAGASPSDWDVDIVRAVGSQPVPSSLWRFVPPDSIGILAASLDSQALYSELLKSMGAKPGERPKVLAELEARYDFSLDRDLFANLGGGAAAYLLPITGVISIPGVALVVELRDAEAFQKGLDGMLRVLEEQGGGDFSVRYKPYRDQPLWTFSFGGGRSGMALAGPLSISPSLAIVEDHLLVTLTSLRAKKEIKRVLQQEAALHPFLEGASAPPEGSTAMGFMDWPALVDGTYEGARAALTMFAGMADEMPFDAEALPSADTFTRYFRPTVMWSVKPTPAARLTRVESSFGPETVLGLMGGGAALGLGIQSQVQNEGRLHGEEDGYPSGVEDPEIRAVIERSEEVLAEVATRLEVFRIESGRYPKNLDELLRPTESYPKGFLGKGAVPVDGWGRDLVYLPATDGSSFLLWSVGENGMDERGGGDDVALP